MQASIHVIMNSFIPFIPLASSVPCHRGAAQNPREMVHKAMYEYEMAGSEGGRWDTNTYPQNYFLLSFIQLSVQGKYRDEQINSETQANSSEVETDVL